MATSKAQQVYVALLNEAVECWRPVEAQHVEADEYVLSGSVPAGELWEFQPGATVRCREKIFQDGGTGLIAFARVRRDA